MAEFSGFKAHPIADWVANYVSEKMATLCSTADVGLFDFNQVALGMRDDFRFDISDYYKFRRDFVAFRMIWRGDNQPLLSNKMTLRDGSGLSPYVMVKAY